MAGILSFCAAGIASNLAAARLVGVFLVRTRTQSGTAELTANSIASGALKAADRTAPTLPAGIFAIGRDWRLGGAPPGSGPMN